MRSFISLFYHDIRLHMRHKTEWSSLVLFFAILIVLMPFALGPEPDILRRLAPGLIWLAALLMSLLSLDRLFVQDANDGTLDEMLTSPVALEAIIFTKLSAQVLVMIAVLAAMVLPAMLLLNMDTQILTTLLLTFILGVPPIVFLGGVAGALTIALKRNAALLTLLLIPFYIPILIFAVSACDAAASSLSPAQPLLFLAAFLALILPSAPVIIAASLRNI